MNTLLDIPKGAEVIDVCKAVEEMMNESEERGELRMLMQFVRDGDLKLERAAEKAKMTVERQVHPRFHGEVGHRYDGSRVLEVEGHL